MPRTRAADAWKISRAACRNVCRRFRKQTALGRDAYIFFLKNVALYPYSPEEILAMGQQEWNRAVAFETYEKNGTRCAAA